MSAALPGARLLEGPSPRGGGNLLYVVGEGERARVLKLYRRRRAAWRAPFRDFGHWLEGKRGVGPKRRYATERELLTLWREAGFDVPQVYDDPLPEGVEPPGLWLEYCPGPTLYACVAGGDMPAEGVRDATTRFAVDLCARQAHALAARDVRFVHEHPSINHVLVHGGRLVSFDLEGAWRTGRDVEAAVAEELAGNVRTLCRADPDAREANVDAFVAGYTDTAQLHRLIERGLRVGPLARLRGLRGKARMALAGKISKRASLRLLATRVQSAGV